MRIDSINSLCVLDIDQSVHLSTRLHFTNPPVPPNPIHIKKNTNRGATCYLNALIQLLYMIPELRQGLYGVDPQELGLEHLLLEEAEAREAAARAAAAAEAERRRLLAAAAAANGGAAPAVVRPDAGIVAQLMDMGFSRHGSERAALACQQQGVDACLEWALGHSGDVDFDTPSPLLVGLPGADPLSSGGGVVGSTPPSSATGEGGKKKDKVRRIPLELQRLFTRLQRADRRALSTDELTSRVCVFVCVGWSMCVCILMHHHHSTNHRSIAYACYPRPPRTPPPTAGVQLEGGRRARPARRPRAGAPPPRPDRPLPCQNLGGRPGEVPLPGRDGLVCPLPRVRHGLGAQRGLLRRVCQRPGEAHAGGALRFEGGWVG